MAAEHHQSPGRCPPFPPSPHPHGYSMKNEPYNGIPEKRGSFCLITAQGWHKVH